MAPEVLNNEKYDYRADVWSVGTIVMFFITGRQLFVEARNKS
jgi:serine/threonine protein kinase